jgi:hypothetical protein
MLCHPLKIKHLPEYQQFKESEEKGIKTKRNGRYKERSTLYERS